MRGWKELNVRVVCEGGKRGWGLGGGLNKYKLSYERFLNIIVWKDERLSYDLDHWLCRQKFTETMNRFEGKSTIQRPELVTVSWTLFKVFIRLNWSKINYVQPLTFSLVPNWLLTLVEQNLLLLARKIFLINWLIKSFPVRRERAAKKTSSATNVRSRNGERREKRQKSQLVAQSTRSSVS